MIRKIDFVSLPPNRVAYLRHLGPDLPDEPVATWRKLVSTLGRLGVHARSRHRFGINWNDRSKVGSERLRYDACVAVNEAFVPADGLEVQTLAGGLYACTPFQGSPREILVAWAAFVVVVEHLDSHTRDAARPELEAYSPALLLTEDTHTISCLLCIPVKARPPARG